MGGKCFGVQAARPNAFASGPCCCTSDCCCKEAGTAVSVPWIPDHAGFMENAVADSIARSASRLPFTVRCEVLQEDIMRVRLSWMGWDLNPENGCGQEIKTPADLFNVYHLLSETRHVFMVCWRRGFLLYPRSGSTTGT